MKCITLVEYLRNAGEKEAADLIESQAQRIAQLEAERDELKRDAERYRWLRDQHQGVATKVDAEWFEYTEPTEHAWMVFRPTAELQSEPVSCIPGELDAAIDAAMREQALDALAKTSEELGGYNAAEIGRAMG